MMWGMLRQTIPPPMADRLLRQYRKFDLLIVVARHLAAAVAALGLDHAIVIENAIDPDQFVPRPRPERLRRQLQLEDLTIVIAHVSNLKSLKRPLDIVASARTTLRCDSRLTYVIVGDGPLRSEMEAACHRDGIADRFRFVGWVDHDCVPDYLNLADVVVMPSAAEARALVYLEAQACGRVLLASDIPAAREVVTDGKDGLLFAVGDVDELTAKTLVAAGDPALRREIGCRARTTALSRSLTRMVDEYETALCRVALRKPAVSVPPRVD
jgi:glycosyltransferase involved in cell wall biosynthesis